MKTTHKHLLAAAALALTATFGLGAAPASAKSQRIAPMACTGGLTGSTSFADLGSGRYNVGFTTATVAHWNVKIFMDGAETPRTNYTTAGPQTLNYLAVLNPPKGKHSFQVVATDVDTAASCSGFVA